ncbi:MAG: zinc ribbon domain-containing protein [Phycisphaerales bacterium]
MSSEPVELADLTSVPSEFEAATIVEALRAQGIPAHHVGGTIAGFRAEVPGLVRVVVRARDLENARLALRAIEAESVDIDWDQVDVGAPEEPARESLPDASGYRCARCGYRLDHIPPERPCPTCGYTLTPDRTHPAAAAAPDTPAFTRRPGVKDLRNQVAFALVIFLGGMVIGLPWFITLALGVTLIVLLAWTIVRAMSAPAAPGTSSAGAAPSADRPASNS